MDEKTRHELLKSVYEQHWLHARHVEYERTWFTVVFAIIIAGSATSLTTIDNKELLPLFATYTASIIFVLSILGWFLCLSWRAPFVEHTTLANKMLVIDSWLKEYTPYAPGYESLKFLGISAHELFLYFYALMVGGALFLFLYVGLAILCLWVSIIVSLILSLTIGALWRLWLIRREKKYVQQIGIGYGKYAKKGIPSKSESKKEDDISHDKNT